MKARRLPRLVLGALVALLLPWLGLVVAACFTPLPAELAGPPSRSTVLVLDRDGRLLREVRLRAERAENPVDLGELSAWVVPALLAAEDARFFRHPGVDPLAVLRASGQLLLERRAVSGASTLTQQLARTLRPRPRTVLGKLGEMALALRIEASLTKAEVLEQYLARVEFGPGLVGIEAASRRYFRKPAASLDLSEAAALVSLPRGPSLYDPRRRPHLLERRRLRVLSRMAALGQIDQTTLARAELTPVRVAEPLVSRGAEHLSFALAERHRAAPDRSARALGTTLSSELQGEAERIALQAVDELERHAGGALALIVLDNQSAEVLAYVGSPSYFDAARQGANDGVRARRQPGSALKPFVYAAAMQQLGATAATLLPDLPRDFATPTGGFSPRNYDQRFRGPVLLREALGSSLNLPALDVSSRLGPGRLLTALHDFGFVSLERDAEHYGVGLALGDGEVTLLEVAGAYASLARGGEQLKPRLLLDEPASAKVRVLRPEVAALVTDILSDDQARSVGFGRDSVLRLPFAFAAKTGTSKGFRDNWAVGYTREVTVAVWVGNFDGAPLRDASGVTVAGPVLREVALAAMRGRTPAPLFDPALLTSADVCTLSGKQPSGACRERRRELFVHGTEPAEACDLHVRVRCGAAERTLERYPSAYLGWARSAGRPIAELTPGCSLTEAPQQPRVTSPRDAQRFALDPDGPRRQEIVLAAEASEPRVRFIVDGRPSEEVTPPFRLPWRLSPGRHCVQVEAGGRRSPPTTFEVIAPEESAPDAEPASRLRVGLRHAEDR